ncbi:rapid alkalinization factor [Lotus japonicus]|uniref:rapid alkalinization factor n=1 Tax=Lotus japonicus TaxID=34305 RepID=UPI00258DB1BE|nr:rapid alkalinization factor [Lotus japonicus]
MAKNNNSRSWLSLLICATVLVAMASSVDAGGAAVGMGWMSAKTLCQGSIADCMGDSSEFEMDSEINRRILATTKYISYGSLRKNTVPCSRRGASYYNCRTGAQANPYNRGCSAIARCRS